VIYFCNSFKRFDLIGFILFMNLSISLLEIWV
jgi:hypothetical protein